MARLLVLLALFLTACSTAPNPDGPSRSTDQTASAAPSPSRPPQADEPDADVRPAYVASVEPIGPALRDRMRFSHGPGCPVELGALRYLRLSYVGFDDKAHVGELVVHRDHARNISDVFRRLYQAGWPIERMQLVDEHAGDDDRSMAANNTSAYNCRRVAGSDSWSTHAYGVAVDLNPVQNPYVTSSSIQPPAGAKFATIDRSADATVPPGVIQEDDVVVRAFAAIGWEWGGHWSGSQDYQHFSASGR